LLYFYKTCFYNGVVKALDEIVKNVVGLTGCV